MRAANNIVFLSSECHLVEAVMLNSTTPKREVEETYERLMNPPANGEEGIKLLYVTVSINTFLEKTDVQPVL